MLRAFILALAVVGVSSLPQPQGRSHGMVPVGFGLYAYGSKIGGFAVNRVNGLSIIYLPISLGYDSQKTSCNAGDVFLNSTVGPNTEFFTSTPTSHGQFTVNTSANTISHAKTGDKLAIPTTSGFVTFLPKDGPENPALETSGMRIFGNTLFFVGASGQLETGWTAVPIGEDSTAFRLGWNVTSDGAVPLALRTIAPGPLNGAIQPGTNGTAPAAAS
ncbi:hypothetical protein PpBr36_02614 [Pyricularia pennisetigena]|uniref:hypothetical protein n=1 Tax=Pyricularia pennisetigena TaxID=1578925 RepID=UPI001151E9E0|nr:hypothetical protein PpBr36_02614 [Pyricularia pennisetigena]TLS30049.1 hypothetical protein PpBr36_02614 [Pyricularia pennisetigena]